jgi:Sugar (pentulose and hexulose) kinases
MQKRSSVTVDELFAGGGGSCSPVVCHIAADVFGLPVHRSQTHEASAVGCAMVALISQGVYGSYEDAVQHMVHTKDVFIPNEENRRTYVKIYCKAYSRLASRLTPIEKYLHHFQTGGH